MRSPLFWNFPQFQKIITTHLCLLHLWELPSSPQSGFEMTGRKVYSFLCFSSSAAAALSSALTSAASQFLFYLSNGVSKGGYGQDSLVRKKFSGRFALKLVIKVPFRSSGASGSEWKRTSGSPSGPSRPAKANEKAPETSFSASPGRRATSEGRTLHKARQSRCQDLDIIIGGHILLIWG